MTYGDETWNMTVGLAHRLHDNQGVMERYARYLVEEQSWDRGYPVEDESCEHHPQMQHAEVAVGYLKQKTELFTFYCGLFICNGICYSNSY